MDENIRRQLEAKRLRELADRDRPRVETYTDRRSSDVYVMRISGWQKCGGGYRRKAPRRAD